MKTRKPVKAKDPRKVAIKMALILKAGAGSKVTMVTENEKDQTFTGRVMQKRTIRDPQRPYRKAQTVWDAVPGGETSSRKSDVCRQEGYFTVSYSEAQV